MQTVLALLAVAAVASAQATAAIPECAQSCVTGGLPQDCNLDPVCICSSTSFIDAISCCVASSCSQADQLATLEYARTICEPAGVTNLPTAAGCPDNGTSTASASSTGSVAQSASSVVSSIENSISSVVESITSEVASITSDAAESATSAAEDAAPTMNVQGLGAVGAGLLGLAALF